MTKLSPEAMKTLRLISDLGSPTPTELSAVVHRCVSQVSRHLQALRKAELIERVPGTSQPTRWRVRDPARVIPKDAPKSIYFEVPPDYSPKYAPADAFITPPIESLHPALQWGMRA